MASTKLHGTERMMGPVETKKARSFRPKSTGAYMYTQWQGQRSSSVHPPFSPHLDKKLSFTHLRLFLSFPLSIITTTADSRLLTFCHPPLRFLPPFPFRDCHDTSVTHQLPPIPTFFFFLRFRPQISPSIFLSSLSSFISLQLIYNLLH